MKEVGLVGFVGVGTAQGSVVREYGSAVKSSMVASGAIFKGFEGCVRVQRVLIVERDRENWGGGRSYGECTYRRIHGPTWWAI